jgi:hypothetical protein
MAKWGVGRCHRHTCLCLMSLLQPVRMHLQQSPCGLIVRLSLLPSIVPDIPLKQPPIMLLLLLLLSSCTLSPSLVIPADQQDRCRHLALCTPAEAAAAGRHRSGECQQRDRRLRRVQHLLPACGGE